MLIYPIKKEDGFITFGTGMIPKTRVFETRLMIDADKLIDIYPGDKKEGSYISEHFFDANELSQKVFTVKDAKELGIEEIEYLSEDRCYKLSLEQKIHQQISELSCESQRT